MKFFSKITAFCLVTIMALGFSGCTNNSANGSQGSSIETIKSKGYVTMATNAEFEPFEYKDGNEIVGIDVDIPKKIAEKLGVELKINDVSFDALTFELKNHTCDFVAAGMSYDEDRAKNVDFSDPYFNATQAVVVKSDSPIASADELSGKRVGVQLGTTADSYCTEQGQIDVVRFNKGMDAIADLISGQIDAVMIDDFPANKYVEKNEGKIKKLDQGLTGEEYVIGVPKGDTEMLSLINSVIAELKTSGELDQIISNYISAD